MAGGTPGGVDDRSLPPVAALLRRPAVRIRHRIMHGLHAAGFSDILPAHLGVFQYPGPEGQRPGVLAVRAQASKQAMNHLLHQLESAGYLSREAHPGDRRTRVVRLTARGRAAAEVIREVAQGIEVEWKQAMGTRTYHDLRRALVRLDEILDGEDASA
jgi:DNA-binding MarR family transcriptional regulator